LLDDVFLYDIDDLQSIAHSHLRERQTEITRSMEILQPHVERYMAWAGRQAEATGPDGLRAGWVTA
jgi:glutamyl-tRNA reductase